MKELNTLIFGKLIAQETTKEKLPKSAILLKFDYLLNENNEIDFNKEIAVYTTNNKRYFRFI